MATVIKPLAPFVPDHRPSVFLSGSIDKGVAVNWQQSLEAALADLDVVVINPRRDDWDSSWKETIDDPQFRGQVEWELNGLERATLIAVYFAPDSKAPITLLELGLFLRSGRVVVCCPEGFWRKGNVDVVCTRYGVPLFADREAFVAEVRRRLTARPS